MSMPTIEELILRMVDNEASDLHINAFTPPMFRIDGHLTSLGYSPMSAQETQDLIFGILNDKQKATLNEAAASELDFSFSVGEIGHIRLNTYIQKGTYALALRHLPFTIPTFGELGLPDDLISLCQKSHGLVLVTGPTGTGKSTTLASMIDYINQNYNKHIITVEDPIEYIYQNKKSLISQREVHIDTASFHTALRTILRQDPDVVLIGEMRDLETISAALTIAETGHLTFATLHTNSCVETINRIIDAFGTERQPQVRTQLSFVLQGILSQKLIPRSNVPGRALALEIMTPSPAIRNLIREGKIHQIYSNMQTGQNSTIMQTMNQSLLDLYMQGRISYEDMFFHSPEVNELMNLVKEQKLR